MLLMAYANPVYCGRKHSRYPLHHNESNLDLIKLWIFFFFFFFLANCATEAGWKMEIFSKFYIYFQS
jgi:hypothetical protein